MMSYDGPDALDSLPLATLLHSRLASWFGDDRQSFLVSDLVPVVTQIVAEFQHNALEMARKADIAERRAEEAEFHVEQLIESRDRAEAELESLEDSAQEQMERVSLHAAEVTAERDAALAVIAEVRRVFDLQCPPMLPGSYVDAGAWMAHSWWNTVLGSVLKRAEKRGA